MLRYFENLTESQIAEAPAIAPGTVKSACARALAKLRASPHLADDAAEPLATHGEDMT